jgi:hypothetical protein
MSRIIFTAALGLGLLSAGAACAQSNSMAPTSTMAPANSMAPASTMSPSDSMAPAGTMAPTSGMTKPDTAMKQDTMGNNAMSHDSMASASTTNKQ